MKKAVAEVAVNEIESGMVVGLGSGSTAALMIKSLANAINTNKLKNIVKSEIIDEKILYFAESSTEKKIVPKFLVDENHSENDIEVLLKGLNIVGDYLDKTILKPNNLNFPITRIHFVNSLK